MERTQLASYKSIIYLRRDREKEREKAKSSYYISFQAIQIHFRKISTNSAHFYPRFIFT